jgi:small subunit ribosomal protein S16
VAVKIKLKRMGKIREPYYRIVVADARTKRDGRAIEEVGLYQPKQEPSLIRVDSDRVQHWLKVGAQPTDPVRHLLTITGDWQKFKGEPGAEGTLRVAEPKANKKDRYDSLVQESFAAKETKEKDSKKKEPAKSRARKSEPKAEPAEPKAEPAEPKAETAETVETAEVKAEPAEDTKAPAEAAEDTKAPAEVTAEQADGGSEA